MATPAKIDLIIGAYQLLRISGLTVDPTPEDVSIALNVMDDYGAQLSTMYETGYIQPDEYNQSDPNDQSGIDREIASAFKKMLAVELATFFGKEITRTLATISEKAERALQQHLVSVPNAQNPATLPLGSGNEWDYRTDKFYPEPNNDDGAVDKFENEVFQLNQDWTSFVGGNLLSSVTYENDSGIDLTNSSFDDTDSTSTTTVSFNRRGQFQLCVSAADDTGNVETRRFVYNSKSCLQTDTYFP